MQLMQRELGNVELVDEEESSSFRYALVERQYLRSLVSLVDSEEIERIKMRS